MSLNLFIIATIIGIEIAKIIEITNYYLNKTNFSNQILLTIYLISIITAILIIYITQIKKYRKIVYILIKEKNSLKFVDKGCKVIKSSTNNVLKSKISLSITHVFTEAGQYQKALEYVKMANFKKSYEAFNKNIFLPAKYKLMYYNNIIYAYLMVNDIVNAQTAFDAGKKIIMKFKNNKNFNTALSHTLAILEYSKGNYRDAENLIAFSLTSTNSKDAIDELNLLKTKIYLKTSRNNEAEILLNELAKNSELQLIRNCALDILKTNSID